MTRVETVKLVASILTPVLVAGLGYLISRTLRRLEDTAWTGRKFVEKRLALYEEMAPMLNDLYCFFDCVGNFRSITPPDAINLKRELDKRFHVNKFLFSPDFRHRYDALMESCYQTWSGLGQNAKLRTSPVRQQAERGEAWSRDWEECFSHLEMATDDADKEELYTKLMKAFAAELGYAGENA